MSLEVPKLDDRSFQDIVQEALRLRSQYCPEWTDDNLSDPGRTLIELFAWMMDMLLYRLNQVPEKNYIAFLDMLGVQLKPPQPARTDLAFTLTKDLAESDEAVVIPAGTEVARKSGPDTDTNAPPISFCTDTELAITPVRLKYLLAGKTNDAEKPINCLALQREEKPYKPFGDPPTIDNCLYVGFSHPMLYHILKVVIEVSTHAQSTIPVWPELAWEWWNGRLWEKLKMDAPGISPEAYMAVLYIPGSQAGGGDSRLYERQIYSREFNACWVRARVTQLRTGSAGLTVTRIWGATTGATIPASHTISVRSEDLGRSSGEPGQVFTVQRPPILPCPEQIDVPDMLLRIEGDDELWEARPDFSHSTTNDKHYICNMSSGEIRFGPAIRGADGIIHQVGKIPPRGARIQLVHYRTGGGILANVSENSLTVIKNPIPFIRSVTNREPARGGRDQETLEQAKWRTGREIRSRDRAVSYQDFEDLALQVPGVARARGWAAGDGEDGPPPGTVRLLIVPDLMGEKHPTAAQLKVSGKPLAGDVKEYLADRCLLCTKLEITEPEYVWVGVNIDEIVIRPKSEPRLVKLQIENTINEFLHPLTGGAGGNGWPFGIPLQVGEIYALLQRIPGVRYVKGIVLRYHQGDEEPKLEMYAVPLKKHQLLASSPKILHNARNLHF